MANSSPENRVPSSSQSTAPFDMYKITVLCLLVAESFSQNCSLAKTTALVYREIDSQPELTHFEAKIQLAGDSFQLLLNQTHVPGLCRGSVQIVDELTVLRIRNCSLQEIEPGAFSIAATLALLEISYNPLVRLKNRVFLDVRCKEIDLSHNAISTIEKGTFGNSTWLEVVRLSYNAIKELDPQWFLNTPNLYKLSMIYNELTEVPRSAFRNLAKNRALRLRLSANMISKVDDGAFDGVSSVRDLWMNGNRLRSLPESLFQNRTIELLEVNTNRLVCFPRSMYGSRMRRLEFLDNQHFRCGCLQEVRSFVEEKRVEVWYPAIICENVTQWVNVVYNFNRTYEIPLLTTSN